MEYVVLFVLGWLLVCLPALIYAGVIERRRRRDHEAADEKFNNLQRQLESLEHRLRKATASTAETTVVPQPSATHAAPLPIAPLVAPKPAAPATEKPAPAAVVTPTTPPPAVASPAIPAPQPESKPAPPPPPPPPMPAPRAPEPVRTAPPPTAAVSPSPTIRPPVPPPIATSAPPRPPAPRAPQVIPLVSQPKPKKPKRSLEEILGVKLLPIIGITIVVIGVGFLLSTGWANFPAWLHVLILYISGGGLLAGGIYLERKNRYRILGRGLIGGGWAVIVATTYAIANRPYELILPNKNVDLFLLLAVIAAMVWHLLRYNSQIVTGAGFLLGFIAIGMNPEPPYNLVAGGMLIVGMTVIVLRYRWFELEVFGILASYINHAYWLYTVYETQGQRATFKHHSASVAIVIGYWIVFRFSYLLRKITSKKNEAVSTFAGLLNPILFLAVMKYQGFHPEWAWKVLLVMGAVEFILGQIPVSRQRRAPFQVLSSLGATLMVAAFAFKYSGNSLDLVWLAGAEAFLLAGIFTRERLFRGFGLIISFLVALHAGAVHLLPLAAQVLNGQKYHDGQVSLVLVVVAAALYANSHATRRLWSDLFKTNPESTSLRILSFIASVFAVAAIYAYVPSHAVAVALALLVVWLSATGKLFSISELIYEAHWVALVAFIQVVAADSALETKWHGIPQRVLAYASVAALFYLSSRFVRLSSAPGKEFFFTGYAWAATSLLALMVWYQAANWAVAIGWVVLALALTLAAQTLKRTDFQWQAFVLVVLSGIRAMAVNFDVTESYHSITYRLMSVSAAALGIYLLARWAPLKQIRPVYTILGTVLLARLAYSETAAPWTAVAWISLASLLCVAARWWKDRPLLWQTHALAILALGWTIYTNFALQYRGSGLQLLTVGITVALFYVLTWITDIAGVIETPRISNAYAWAGSLLASWLVWYQLDPPVVSLAWGVFGVVLYELPDLLGKLKIDCTRSLSSWHGQSYVALLCSFAHVFYANFNSPPAGSLLDVLRDPNVLTVVPLAPIYFYIYWRLRSEAQSKPLAKAVSA